MKSLQKVINLLNNFLKFIYSYVFMFRYKILQNYSFITQKCTLNKNNAQVVKSNCLSI